MARRAISIGGTDKMNFLSAFVNKIGKKPESDDDVDYYDKQTHAICATELEKDYLKEL